MKKFVLCDLQSGAENEYDGERVESSTYRFVNTKKESDSLMIEVLGPRKINFNRKVDTLQIEAVLEENRISQLKIIAALNNDVQCGEFPILVRDVIFEYPQKILLRYHLLDDKNIPIETCEILVSEKL